MNGEITQKQLEQATAGIIDDEIDNFIADVYLNDDFRQIKLPINEEGQSCDLQKVW